MKTLYVVVKYTKGWDWENYENVCLVESKELADSIVEWLKKNDEVFKDTTVEYCVGSRMVVSDMDEFVKFWEEV